MSAPKSDITSTVMDQIKSGKVRMKPRSYYTLLAVVSIVAVTLAGLSIAYLSSIMFFWFRIQTADTMAWGARANLSTAIDSFPWWALIVAILLSIVAIMLVRHQGRTYKHKTSTVALVLLLCSLLVGFGLSFFDIGQPSGDHRDNQGTEQRGPGWNRNQ